MTTKYRRIREITEACQCQVCRGSGKEDDMDLGDISFNEWTCRGCRGTGINPVFLSNVEKALETLETFPWRTKEKS